MDRAVIKAFLVHFVAGSAADNPVRKINHIEIFFAHVWELPARDLVSCTNCSRETASARILGERSASLKAAKSRGSGQCCLSNFSIIFRRWENACLTILMNAFSAGPESRGIERNRKVIQVESTSGSGKKHVRGILNDVSG